ncbi:OLC1v1025344C1 [Oldenlandia corymbosa var. corymbosa]|uniref:non-specific serine/threonine protein kinase n=1 Tax=Oldenlandia corymbosa var. corymbosa TaxID=529605 RepID=A0AAV1C519_OLDCO|nr:OLC1v1025344C1 [Oldenlandia corymbosa var. corymbosa]
MASLTSMIFSAVILFLHYVSSAAIASNKSDQSALLALKSQISFSSNNVFLDKNWSAESSSVCSWMGVICSLRHNRVIALDISNLGLNGTIPPELGNLSFLSSLDISNNSFHGNLPDELAQLHRLKMLDMGRNNFSGPIPSFFDSLRNLQYLYCSRNAFSGIIPPSIANLSKLEELSLSRNFLEGSIPEEIGNLHFLTSLNLEGNKLSGPIPPSIFNLSMLQSLGFSGNNLSGTLPPDICDNLPKLEGLYLSSNELEGRIPPGMGKCLQLQVLSLSGNNFIGSIPREIGNLTLLTVLFLGGNYLEDSIPSEIGNLQSLEVLGVNGNRYLSGSIPETIFNISSLQTFTCWGNNLSGHLPFNMGQGMQHLGEIYLGDNNLSGIIPDSISNATGLRILDFESNRFTGSIPKSIGNLESLELVYLGENNLKVESSSSELEFLTSLTKCRNLSEIVILGNPFNGKFPSSVGNFSTTLRKFVASNCKIMGTIPNDIDKLSTVALLDLSDNDLSGFIPRTVSGLQRLQELYLDNNKIRGSIPGDICSLSNLGALGLGGNQISGVVPSCIGKITSLRHLNLASNNLSSNLPPRPIYLNRPKKKRLPPSLWMLKDLLQFNASSNSLTGNLPPEIGNVKVITAIDLSNNFISGNIPDSIGGLQNLINLSLAHNDLDGPIPESFGKLVSLEALDLSQNKLTGEIPESLEDLVYLKKFNISFNQLSGKIPSNGSFQNFTNESFVSNDALCGAPRFQVMPCPVISLKRRRKCKLLVVYALLGVSSLVLASVFYFLLIRRPKKKKDTIEEAVASVALTLERISYHELKKATSGFNESNLVGTGSYSSVYKGMLTDGTSIAVKVFNLKFSGAEKSFDTECEVLRCIRHRNLTKVITSCSNLHMDFKALVLEYMPNGSLEKWLYSHNYFLDIFQRLDIMIDVASALDYLHNGHVTPVVHCDVKPRNVLLDEDMIGHVCDFGIAKLLTAENATAVTQTFATIGYIAPEYGIDGRVSTKCDVYSYGILMMETFTRTKPSDDMFTGNITLRKWVLDSFPSRILQVADSNLLNPNEEKFHAKLRCVSSVMELALGCTAESPDARKDMHDVLLSLKKLRTEFLSSCGIKGSSQDILTTVVKKLVELEARILEIETQLLNPTSETGAQEPGSPQKVPKRDGKGVASEEVLKTPSKIDQLQQSYAPFKDEIHQLLEQKDEKQWDRRNPIESSTRAVESQEVALARFKQGLRPEIRNQMVTHQIKTIEEVFILH